MPKTIFDLAIVGAGPAGMAAADAACAQGMNVIIVDDQDRAGGQILRRPPAEFSLREWLPQRVYRHLHVLYAKFTQLENLTVLNNTAVVGVTSESDRFALQTVGSSGLTQLLASKVLVATGCFDMPLAFSGAQLPGVMATGGLQAYVKSQQILPGERFLFVGSHPLQLIVANQIADAGGDVAAVVFTRRKRDYLQLLRSPLILLRQLPNMLFFLGVVLQLLIKRVPIKFGNELVAAEGNGELQKVKLTSTGGTGEINEFLCDRLGLCFGFLTNNDLVRQAGVSCEWSQTAGGWVAEHDQSLRTSVKGIYVAGETAGVAGANVAYLEGRLAASSAAFDMGIMDQDTYDEARKELCPSLLAARQFGSLLAEISYPGDTFIAQAMVDDAYLCKCEEVTVGSVINSLEENADICDLSALKLFTRCGMGHCQGRYCHYQSRALLARKRSIAPESAGGFTARFPSRPVTVNDLIGEPGVDEE